MPGMMKTLWRMRKGPKSLAPYAIARRHRKLFLARMVVESALLTSRTVDVHLKDLAGLRASSLAGCHW